jgi:Flp pilus assembly pilin Flp
LNDKKMNPLAFWVDDTGAATAEYAIATMAAVGFAGLLVVIMRSDEVRTILFDLVKSALTFTNPNAAPTQ